MTAPRTRTSRPRRIIVVAALALATLMPTAAHAAPSSDAPGQGKKAATETTVTTQGLSWLGLSWL